MKTGVAQRVGFEPTGRFLAGQTISSRSRYDPFDTAAYLIGKKMLRNASEKGEKSRREKAKNCSLLIPRKP